MNATITDIKKHIAQNGLLIDTRDYDECNETGVIPSAEIIPLSEIENAFLMSEEEFEEEYDFSKPSKTDVIILYCATGGRSRVAASILTKLGYTAKNYVGSFVEWENLENEIEFLSE